MHRFFVEPQQIQEEIIEIIGDDFKHITKVLRLRENETIEVCDGSGNDYEVILRKPGDKEITGKILKTSKSKGETIGMQVTLFQGVPKGQKMELIIQKNVELGVFEIIPFHSKRSVSQIKEKKEKKIERWQRIAYEAGKQSKRGVIPKVTDVLNLKEILKLVSDFDLFLMAYEDEKQQTLKNTLKEVSIEAFKERNLKVGVLIGPEGGFDFSEVEECKKCGMKVVTLGSRILRTETAGMVLLSQLNFWKED